VLALARLEAGPYLGVPVGGDHSGRDVLLSGGIVGDGCRFRLQMESKYYGPKTKTCSSWTYFRGNFAGMILSVSGDANVYTDIWLYYN
jgi:hypothetical protein